MSQLADVPSTSAAQPLCGPEGWAAQRRQWTRKTRKRTNGETEPKQARLPVIPLNAGYEEVLGGSRRFDEPVPLKVRWALRAKGGVEV